MTLLFPATCIGCAEEILPAAGPSRHQDCDENPPDQSTATDFLKSFDTHWCSGCWRELTTSAPHQCHKCGVNIFQPNPFENRCAHCFESELRFERAVSIGNYRGLLQELVIRMKNQHDEQLAVQLGNILAWELLEADFVNDLDLVIPVPSHWWRRVRRGFLASEIISETIGRDCDIPYAGQILNCIRGTKKQGTLSTPGRFKNVRGAFKIRPTHSVTGLNVLIVDDVMTSGATASELARVLINAGAAKVYVGVIARGARVS